MNAHGRAAMGLGWLLWRRHRWGISAVALMMVVAALTARAGPWGPSMMTGLILPLGLGLVYLVTVFVFEGKDLAARESGFPSYLWTLPVRTVELVVWPMVFGVVTVGMGWVLLARLVMVPLGMPAAVVWPAALLGAIVASVQAMLWAPLPLPFLRVVAVCCAVVGLVTVGVGGREAWGLAEETLVGVYGGVVVMAFVVALRGVVRARRGEELRWQWLPGFVLERGSATAERRWRAFASPGAAQFWMEWRQNGMMLVLLCAVVWVMIAGTMVWAWRYAPHVDRLTPGKVMMQLVPLLLLPPAFGVMLGAGPRNTLIGRKDMGMSAFMGTRPIPGHTFVAAKLKGAAAGTAAAWGVTLALMGLLMLTTIRLEGGDRMLGAIVMEHATPRNVLLASLALLAAVGITWKLQVDGLFVALTGRGWIATVNSIAMGALMTVALVLGATLYAHPEWREQGERIGLWAGVVLVMVKLALAAWTGRALVARKLMSGARTWGWFGGWAGAVMVASVTAWAVAPDPLRPAPGAIVIVAMLLMPLVRLGAALLAVEWNRHR